MLCKHCKKSIPNSATVCPYCGKSVKPLKGKNTGDGFSLGKLIAFIGSVLVLVSVFVPALSLNFAAIRIVFDIGDVRKWILIVASVVSIVALFAPRLKFLYPLMTIVISGVSSDFLRFVVSYIRSIGGFAHLFMGNGFGNMILTFTTNYSPLFMIGYTIMAIASIVMIIKFMINGILSK